MKTTKIVGAAAILIVLSYHAWAQQGLDIPKNMKPYFVALLVKGDKYTDEQTPEVQDLLRRHLSYIRTQFEAGTYVVAGPFTDNSRAAGIFIVNAPTRETAEKILNEDPTVKAGRFKVEIHPAMLPEVRSGPKY